VSTPGVERKLAGILSADVVGYSRLIGEDETGTIRRLTEYRLLADMGATRHAEARRSWTRS
jgi:adenylate cyclase